MRKILWGLCLLMALALTACNEPNNPPVNNNDDTPNDSMPGELTGTCLVRFETEQWMPDSFVVFNDLDDELVEIRLVRNKTGETLTGLMASNTGSYDYNLLGGSALRYDNPTSVWTDTLGIVGAPGSIQSRWMAIPESFTEDVVSFDFNTMTLTATISQQFYDYEAYAKANGDTTGLQRYTLSCIARNYRFTLGAR
ncbi:MAG: hypothetical protein Q4D14_05225 [Bacteroidales bacterium]|nr:hypothetical protein [Bacteroidales bacterium]